MRMNINIIEGCTSSQSTIIISWGGAQMFIFTLRARHIVRMANKFLKGHHHQHHHAIIPDGQSVVVYIQTSVAGVNHLHLCARGDFSIWSSQSLLKISETLNLSIRIST